LIIYYHFKHICSLSGVVYVKYPNSQILQIDLLFIISHVEQLEGQLTPDGSKPSDITLNYHNYFKKIYTQKR